MEAPGKSSMILSADMLRRIDRSNYTFEDCLELAITFYRGFENDRPLNQGIPQDYLFTSLESRIMSIFSPRDRLDKIVQLAQNYRRKMHGAAWAFYSRICDPNMRAYLFYDDNKVVGCSIWRLSRFDAAKLTWWQWLQTWTLKLYGMFRLWLTFPLGTYAFLSPGKFRYYDHIRDVHGFHDKPEQYTALAHKSYDELRSALYPNNGVTYCEVFCTLVQRKGYGQKFFPQVLADLQCVQPVFKDGDCESTGPAKLGLTATAAGVGLYKRCGFVAEKPVHQEVEGEMETGTLMFKVLD